MKLNRKSRRSFVSPDSELHCQRCFLQKPWCICDELPQIATRLSMVVVRHWKERYRTSNSARLLSLALEGCELLEWDNRLQHEASLELGQPDPEECLLLFPPPGEFPVVDEGFLEACASAPPKRLYVLDGTWRQVRRMVNRLPELKALPRLFLPPPSTPPKRLREPQQAWAMSTIEAVARALELLEDPAPAAALDQLFHEYVRRLHLQRDGTII